MKRGIRMASSATELQPAAHMLRAYILTNTLLPAVNVDKKKMTVDTPRYLHTARGYEAWPAHQACAIFGSSSIHSDHGI